MMKKQKDCMPVRYCFIPVIEFQSVEDKFLNKYGRMRREFLEEQNPAPDRGMDAMDWIRHMNVLREMEEDLVVREVIYSG